MIPNLTGDDKPAKNQAANHRAYYGPSSLGTHGHEDYDHSQSQHKNLLLLRDGAIGRERGSLSQDVAGGNGGFAARCFGQVKAGGPAGRSFEATPRCSTFVEYGEEVGEAVLRRGTALGSAARCLVRSPADHANGHGDVRAAERHVA